ncbi:hypothetical protein P5673_019814 [Acropora cervicornis]|uniref:Uncharacterized protein n=1 Tax=Acropora cervicornis TaxID=6130 RepID=A0AAD9QAR5_ACRCE|nr:hypothetical protein P5673_019814 [Acropora cervicornis]
MHWKGNKFHTKIDLAMRIRSCWKTQECCRSHLGDFAIALALQTLICQTSKCKNCSQSGQRNLLGRNQTEH